MVQMLVCWSLRHCVDCRDRFRCCYTRQLWTVSRQRLKGCTDVEQVRTRGLCRRGLQQSTSEFEHHWCSCRKKAPRILFPMAAMAHPAKRARLAPASTPHTQKADALSVITFHLADPAQATKLTELCSFKPEFCHQLFGEDEEVKGWKDPSIDVWLSPITFSCYLDFRWVPTRFTPNILTATR